MDGCTWMAACVRHRLIAAAGSSTGVVLWAHCHGACGSLGHDTGLGGAWLCLSWLGTALFNQGQVYFAWGLTLEVSGLGNVPPWWPHTDPTLLLAPSISLNGMKVSRPDIRIGRYRMIKHERDKHNEPNPQR